MIWGNITQTYDKFASSLIPAKWVTCNDPRHDSQLSSFPASLSQCLSSTRCQWGKGVDHITQRDPTTSPSGTTITRWLKTPSMYDISRYIGASYMFMSCTRHGKSYLVWSTALVYVFLLWNPIWPLRTKWHSQEPSVSFTSWSTTTKTRNLWNDHAATVLWCLRGEISQS